MKHILLAFFRFYQKYISPATPPSCRFHPTCSTYGIQALQTHGAIKGSLLTIWRILKCQPFHPGGFDPIPDKHKWKPTIPTIEEDIEKEVK